MKLSASAILALTGVAPALAATIPGYTPTPTPASPITAAPTPTHSVILYGVCTPENADDDCVAGHHTAPHFPVSSGSSYYLPNHEPHFPVSIGSSYYLPAQAITMSPTSTPTSQPASQTSWSFTHRPKHSVWTAHDPSTIKTRTKGWNTVSNSTSTVMLPTGTPSPKPSVLVADTTTINAPPTPASKAWDPAFPGQVDPKVPFYTQEDIDAALAAVTGVPTPTSVTKRQLVPAELNPLLASVLPAGSYPDSQPTTLQTVAVTSSVPSTTTSQTSCSATPHRCGFGVWRHCC